jgi:NADPH-dependent 2,4-dienoyl-CoA reductase/sulfur reductase-like enzyme
MAIPYLLKAISTNPAPTCARTAGHFERCASQRDGRVVAVDAEKQTVLFADGHFRAYDRLLIATGSHPVRRRFPASTCRRCKPAGRWPMPAPLPRWPSPGARVLQLGAGFIGCIIMEALVARGVQLTVVEMGDRMVPRMMTPEAGGMIKRWVEKQGVRVVTKAGVERIENGERICR